MLYEVGYASTMEKETVKVTLTNRRAALVYPYPAEELKPFFQFRPKGYEWSPKYRQHVWDGNITLIKNGKVGTGLFLAQRAAVEKGSAVTFRVKDTRTFPSYHHADPRKVTIDGWELRDHQYGAVLAMMQHSNTGGLVLNATGTGKTVTAGVYFKNLIGSGVFVVDELTLLDQARKELAQILGEPVGIVGNAKFEPQRITVATVQTLARNRAKAAFKRWAKQVAVMIIDELHLMLNKRQADVVRAFNPQAVFGLTATLGLQKTEVRYKAFDLCGPVVYEYPYEQGVSEHVLSPGVVVGVDLRREAPDSVDYDWLYVERIVRSQRRNSVVADLVQEGIARGKHVVVLVERVRHLKILSKLLRGITHAVVYGDMPVAQRIKAKERFDSGELKLLICNKVFKKGINLKRLDCIIDAAAMYSANDAVQKYGRGVRTCANKRGLLYFDIGDRKPVDRAKTNRFTAATKSRRKALSGIGVQVIPKLARLGAASLYDTAEKVLTHVVDARPKKTRKIA